MSSSLYKTDTEENDSISFLLTFWQQFLALTEQDLGKRTIESWFRSLKCHSWSRRERRLTIITPNSFVQKWIEKNYLFVMQKNAARILNETTLTLIFVIEEKASQKKINSEKNADKQRGIIPAKQKKLLAVTPSILENDYTFDHFVVDEANRCVIEAAKKIPSETKYHLLVIHGASGMGKTHVSNAICHELIQKKIHFLYQTADKFVYDYVKAVRAGKIDLLENTFNEIEAFIIDDIQAIAAKVQTQEFFLKILTSLLQKKRKVVITLDKTPQFLKGITDRIRSKLDGGLILSLQMPNKETLRSIIIKKANFYGIHDLSDEIIDFISSCVNNSVREIDGFIIKLAAHYEFNKKNMDIKEIRSLIQQRKEDLFKQNMDQDEQLKKILLFVAERCALKGQDLFEKSRKRNILFARQLSMYIMRKYTNASLTEIGEFFRGFNHSTVLHSIKKIDDKMKKIDKCDKFEFIKDIEKNIKKCCVNVA